MVNGILLEDNAYATVIIRDSQFIGGSGTDEDYTFVYDSDSTLTTSGLVTGVTTVAPTSAPTAAPTVNPSANPSANETASPTTSPTPNSSSSGNGSDSHGFVGLFGGHMELILIVLGAVVCIIMICCCVVIRLMKIKNEQRKNVQLEVDEHLANNLSGDHKGAEDHERGQTQKNGNAMTAPGDDVEMPQVNFETVATLKSLSSSSLGFHKGDVILDDREAEFDDKNAAPVAYSNGGHTVGLSVSDQENGKERAKNVVSQSINQVRLMGKGSIET